MTDPDNRRASFRISDSMSLRINPLEPKRLDEILENFDAYRLEFCLKSHFLMQQELRQGSLQLIRKRDPDIANYLQHLEHQMLLLADRMTSNQDTVSPIAIDVDVTLSGSGMSFDTDETFTLGQVVELGMRLSTNGTQIIVLATVVRLDPSEEGDNVSQRVSLNFSHIHHDDSEAIIRHMFKLQQSQLQARRLSEQSALESTVQR